MQVLGTHCDAHGEDERLRDAAVAVRVVHAQGASDHHAVVAAFGA